MSILKLSFYWFYLCCTKCICECTFWWIVSFVKNNNVTWLFFMFCWCLNVLWLTNRDVLWWFFVVKSLTHTFCRLCKKSFYWLCNYCFSIFLASFFCRHRNFFWIFCFYFLILKRSLLLLQKSLSWLLVIVILWFFSISHNSIFCSTHLLFYCEFFVCILFQNCILSTFSIIWSNVE